MNTEKIVINPTGDKILFGKNIIPLEDKTRGKYSTHNLADFKKALPETTVVYIDGTALTAFANDEVNNAVYTTEPIAVCSLLYNPILQILRNTNKKEFDLSSFTDFVRSMKPYLLKDSLPMHDALNDLKIKKVVDIESQSDRRGNFCFTVKADKGKQDYEFPLQIGFEVPLFEENEEMKIELHYELLFTWGIQEADVRMAFKLVNYSQEVIIDKVVKQNIIKTFENSGIEIFSGKFEVIKKTDEYKYKESSLTL